LRESGRQEDRHRPDPAAGDRPGAPDRLAVPEESEWMAADLFLDAKCAANAGPIASHMSTANVARDLDRLRAAVGDSGLNYAGVSYGSYLGVTYANLFPDHVRALIVDGILDPIAWSTGDGNSAATLPFSTREG